MPSSIATLKLAPAHAAVALVSCHVVLLLAALALAALGPVSEVIGLSSIVLPGLLAGYLTRSHPAVVGAVGAVAIYALGLLVMLLTSGGLSVGLLLFSATSDVAQAAITLAACVGGHVLRRRLLEKSGANAI